MDPTDMHGSTISTADVNIDKNTTGQEKGSTKKIEPAHLKKNEFALILFGALVLTVVIFFLFFRSSDTRIEEIKTTPSSEIQTNMSSLSLADLENRIEVLENTREMREKSVGASDDSGKGVVDIGPVKERVTNLEAAFAVKFDSLIKRMDAIEKGFSEQKKESVAVTIPKPVVPVKPSVPVKKENKTGLFHTIKKGETLYSISLKYNTTVAVIRNLNKMSVDDKIYVGDAILVR